MDEFHFLKFQDKLGQMEFQGVTGPLKYVYQGDPQTTPGFPNGLPGPDPDGMTNVWQVADTQSVVTLPPTGVVAPGGFAGIDWKVSKLIFQGFNGELEEVTPGDPLA